MNRVCERASTFNVTLRADAETVKGEREMLGKVVTRVMHTTQLHI
jgi:hypothetical protein